MHALSWQRHAQPADRDGRHIVHAGERCSALSAPSPLLSPSASDNHTKRNLQHCLHLFTFTNYILLKLPRKICQKNVITQSWNLASSQISSIFKKHYGISLSRQHQAAARDRAEPQWLLPSLTGGAEAWHLQVGMVEATRTPTSPRLWSLSLRGSFGLRWSPGLWCLGRVGHARSPPQARQPRGLGQFSGQAESHLCEALVENGALSVQVRAALPQVPISRLQP